jgi:hypothetical protein
MRRFVFLALALLCLTVASPGIEAVAGCVVPCADEAAGPEDCASDACCSCCLHAGPLSAALPAGLALPERADRSGLPRAGAPRPAAPFEILHVPKPLA